MKGLNEMPRLNLTKNKALKRDLAKLKQEIHQRKGKAIFRYNHEHPEPNQLVFYLEPPYTTKYRVASIEWYTDPRFDKVTFNVKTYNENFELSSRQRKQARHLQMLATKYASKFWRDINFAGQQTQPKHWTRRQKKDEEK